PQIGDVFDVEWVTIDNPLPNDDSVRHQAQAKGAAIFNRGEGLAMADGNVYVCASGGGPVQAGQIFKYIPDSDHKTGKLALLTQSTSRSKLEMPDNLTINRRGDVFMAEDGLNDQ